MKLLFPTAAHYPWGPDQELDRAYTIEEERILVLFHLTSFTQLTESISASKSCRGPQ